MYSKTLMGRWTSPTKVLSSLSQLIFRSCHQRCSIKKGVLKNFAKFTGKHVCQSPLFNQVAGLRPATLQKERLWHRCFFCELCEIFKNTFFTEHLWTTLVLWGGDCFNVTEFLALASIRVILCLQYLSM